MLRVFAWCTVRLGALAAATQRRRGKAVGLVAQMICQPLIAIALMIGLKPAPAIGRGLLLLAR